jgi:hypothetical protein
MKYKEECTVYKKVGDRFVPISDPWAYEGLREGWWIVRVQPGSTSIRQCIYPDKAPIQAAALELEDQLTGIIRAASQARPFQSPITPQLKRDWDKFLAKHGNQFSNLQYPSFQQNAEDIINAILKS